MSNSTIDSYLVYEDINRRSVQFLVTEACNLDCVYCYEKNRNPRSLTEAFIKEKIFEEMRADNGYDELSIEFFGGEPLLKFEVIRSVVEWFLKVQWSENSKAFRFTITSNATLLNQEMKEWLSKHRREVTLCLSMDGTPDAQNRNRSGSYDAVIKHIPFVLETWPDQPVKMTVSQYTLDQMYEGVKHIHDLGFSVEPNIVFENVWGSDSERQKAVKTYAQQLEKLVVFYAANPNIQRPRLLFHNILGLYGRPKEKMKRAFCGAGRHMTCYAADGQQYPCMRFAPICTKHPLQDIEKGDKRWNKNCDDCVFEILCPTCEGHNYEVTGSCFSRTDYHCEFFKLELLASARLCFLDEMTHSQSANSNDTEFNRENLNLLRKYLAIKFINDQCGYLME